MAHYLLWINLYLGFLVPLLFILAGFVYSKQYFKTRECTAVWLFFAITFFGFGLNTLFFAFYTMYGGIALVNLSNASLGISIVSLVYGLFLYERERIVVIN